MVTIQTIKIDVDETDEKLFVFELRNLKVDAGNEPILLDLLRFKAEIINVKKKYTHFYILDGGYAVHTTGFMFLEKRNFKLKVGELNKVYINNEVYLRKDIPHKIKQNEKSNSYRVFAARCSVILSMLRDKGLHFITRFRH